MGELYWENGERMACYQTVETPFGIVRRLVPGSLKRKEEPRMPGESESWRANRSVRPADGGPGCSPSRL